MGLCIELAMLAAAQLIVAAMGLSAPDESCS